MMHSLSVSLLLSVTVFAFLSVMTERRYSGRKTALIYGLACVFMSLLSTFLHTALQGSRSLQLGTVFAAGGLLSYGVFLLASGDPLCKKTFLYLNYPTAFCIFYTIGTLLVKNYFPHLTHIQSVYLRAVLVAVFTLVAMPIYMYHWRPAVRQLPGIQQEKWNFLSLLTVLFLLLFSLFAISSETHYSDSLYAVGFSISVLIYVAVLQIIFAVIHRMRQENTADLVQQNLEYLQNRLEYLSKNNARTRTFRHDLRHHLQSLLVLLRDGKTDEAVRYVEAYGASLEEVKTREFCPHLTVNAILNNFYIKARNEGIPFIAAADTPAHAGVENLDFVAILSNLLENAFHGRKKSGRDEEIRVSIRSLNGKTVIVCSNPCPEDVTVRDGMLTKHGVGVESVLTAARKYNGTVRYEKDGHLLTVCLILEA